MPHIRQHDTLSFKGIVAIEPAANAGQAGLPEEWHHTHADGAAAFAQNERNMPDEAVRQQNLRFQGQYLDRDAGLHYNTSCYCDPDIGRFISPDPIGLAGEINLSSCAPNPVSWIDSWGWRCGNGNENKPGFIFDPGTRQYGNTSGSLFNICSRVQKADSDGLRRCQSSPGIQPGCGLRLASHPEPLFCPSQPNA